MSVCPIVSELRFYGCCHPCLFMGIRGKNEIKFTHGGYSRQSNFCHKYICHKNTFVIKTFDIMVCLS